MTAARRYASTACDAPTVPIDEPDLICDRRHRLGPHQRPGAPNVTRDELLTVLKSLGEEDGNADYDAVHREAEAALLEYINDDAVTAAYDPYGLWWYS